MLIELETLLQIYEAKRRKSRCQRLKTMFDPETDGHPFINACFNWMMKQILHGKSIANWLFGVPGKGKFGGLKWIFWICIFFPQKLDVSIG